MIIKPVLDALGILPVSTISFLSGCTVLAMALSSLRSGGKNEPRADLRQTAPLAVGAALGGLLGKWLFEAVRNGFPDENVLGAFQSVCLTLMTLLIFVYVLCRSGLRSFHVTSPALSVAVGLALGLVSSFLGIGGGPLNVAILFLLYSMDAKTAARNSLIIIVFSQTVSLLASAATGTVPAFSPLSLLLMAAGGVTGGLLGAAVSRRLTSAHVELLLKVLLIAVICIGIGNILKFTALS